MMPNRRARRRESGFSLVEALLGLVILLVALTGLLPLFTRSIQQNVEGKQSSDSTAFGRTELENLMQADFNNWELTVPSGANQLTQTRFWTLADPQILGDESWLLTDPPSEVAPWQITSVVRQFQITGVRDDDLDGIMEVIEGLEDTNRDGQFDSPIPGGSPPGFVHLKGLDVALQNRAWVPTVGDRSRLELAVLKAF